MFLFPFRLQSPDMVAWPLGALLFAAGAPASAQNTSRNTSQIVSNAPVAPQLTLEPRPSSSIAGAVRPQFTPAVARQGRSLLITFPVVAAEIPRNAAVVSPSVSNAIPARKTANIALGTANPAVGLSGNALPQTLISPAKRVKVATKTRFAASRVSAQIPTSPPGVLNGGATSTLSSTPVSSTPVSPTPAPALAGVSQLPITPEVTAPSPRERMARLPSRGGLSQNRAPVELRPAPPETVAISDASRRLLAKLDADLGRAHRRGDRSITRLTESQRQLGAVAGVLQTAMLDSGEDGRGLHPFVRVAQRYMGTPYVWGGESARGFDCSGFIMRVMRDLGYQALPHSAAEQFNYGLPISKGLLKPGDIVFFANTYKPGVSHVGIYLGRGRFIHAANSKVGTIVSGLNEPKWVEHYAGARRLIRVNS